ncbi:hypothetical protein JAAARDRAFT_143479, partial [Jaapia argillacea MUCL 33604]
TCNNHQTITLGNMSHKHLQVTGIGAAACARHGAFCPHSCVNFQKGERQMNMDYALVQAFRRTMGGISLYDINCQFAMNLLRRIAANHQHLSLAKGLKIIHGIGLFHIHGHQDSCTP